MEILTDIATKIGFDWKLAVTHTINLGLIFFLLVKFALPSIKKIIDERTAKIKEGLRMRDEADKIKLDAENVAKDINKMANTKAQEVISKSEVSAKNIVTDASAKSGEIIRLANLQKDEAKNAGLKDAENYVSKNIATILTKISAAAFDSKITAENNSDFVSKVFKAL